MTRRLIVTLLLIAGPLAAQDPRVSERFAPPIAMRLNAVLDSAAREGLPTEPMVLRALEGSAKGIAPQKIFDVLGRLRDALRTSRKTIGAKAGAEELTTCAAALQAGVRETRLAELHRLRNGMPVTAPLGAYLDLVARGADRERAWTRITELTRRKATDAEFARLMPADLGADAGSGSGRHRAATWEPPR